MLKRATAWRTVPRRTTFYGADEIFVREPGGHILGFAEMSEPGPDGD